MRIILGTLIAIILVLGFIYPGSFLGRPIWATPGPVVQPQPGQPGQPGAPAPGQPIRIPAIVDVAIEPDGRIWLPNFREGMGRFSGACFPFPQGNATREFRGINASLTEESTGRTIVANANGVRLTLQPGKRYCFNGGDFNGGASLELVR